MLDEETDKEIYDSVRKIINEATDAVEAAPYPGTENFYKHVYADSGGAP